MVVWRYLAAQEAHCDVCALANQGNDAKKSVADQPLWIDCCEKFVLTQTGGLLVVLYLSDDAALC